MNSKITVPVLWCMISLFSIGGFAAGSGDLRLVNAAKQGDKQALRSLLKQHGDVNSRQPDGATALAWAAYRDDLEMADLLIRAGANVNTANDYGVTPLSLACTNGGAPMVDKLLHAGANANAATWTGETVLMSCARTGTVDVVKSLLARGADANAAETRHADTALMWAAASKHPEVVHLLIEHGSDVNAHSKNGFTPLMFAAQQGDLESARMLVIAGATVNEVTPDGDTPLLVASLNGSEAVGIFLLEKGANPNAADRNGITALHFSVLTGLAQLVTSKIFARPFAPYLFRHNLVDLVKALLAHGAKPNAQLISPVVWNDVGPGYGKIIRVNYSDSGNVSPVGATPFLLAAVSSDASLMRILAAGGADPRLATEENITPLMAAAGLSQIRSNPGLTDEEDKRALEAVKVAVELGDDLNTADTRTGLTALHAAAFLGSNSIVQFLVGKGANINTKDHAGQTPLHKALNIKPPADSDSNLIPKITRKSTAELLLKLGATPVSAVVAQASDVK